MKSERRRNSSEIVKFSGSADGSFCRDKKLDRMLTPVGKWSRAYWGQNLDCHQHLPPASQDLPDFLLISLRFATYFAAEIYLFKNAFTYSFKAQCLFGVSLESPFSDSVHCQVENGFRVLTWTQDGCYGVLWYGSVWFNEVLLGLEQ